MGIYHCGDSSPGKWTIAGLVVIAAIMFTPAAGNAINIHYNLAGANVEVGDHGAGGTHGIGNITGISNKGGNGGKWEPNQNGLAHHFKKGKLDPKTEPATSVPEPGTLVLLASGLGMMLWRRNRKLL